MSYAGPRYDGLLGSLAARHGCTLEYSLPELVSGGLTPPPSRVYPGRVCYMMTVQVGGSSYLGFGPNPLIAKHVAEFEAYRSLRESFSAEDYQSPASCGLMPNLEAESWTSRDLEDGLVVDNGGGKSQTVDITAEGSPNKMHRRETDICLPSGADMPGKTTDGVRVPSESTSSDSIKIGSPTTEGNAINHNSDEIASTGLLPQSSNTGGSSKHDTSSTAKGVNRNRAQPHSSQPHPGRSERFCEIPQVFEKEYTVPEDHNSLMQALEKVPPDTDSEEKQSAFTFTGAEKRDIADVALQAARHRGLNVCFKISVVGPPYAKMVVVKAICGGMEFEGQHLKKKVARAIAAKKLLDALESKPSRVQDGVYSWQRALKREFSHPHSASASTPLRAKFGKDKSLVLDSSQQVNPEQQREGATQVEDAQHRSPIPSDSGFMSASFQESDSCAPVPVSDPIVNDTSRGSPASNCNGDAVPGSKGTCSPSSVVTSNMNDKDKLPSSGANDIPNGTQITGAGGEGSLAPRPASSMNHIQQSSSSEYESEGALSVMSLPISTLRQRTMARGCSRNPVGQLQEVMMKEQHCLPVYAEAVESVGKYTEYICVVSAKGLSAKGVGCSKKLARRHAAENMLAVMEGEGMNTNPSLIHVENRTKKLMRLSSSRPRSATSFNPNSPQQQAVRHHHSSLPSPSSSSPSPSSPCGPHPSNQQAPPHPPDLQAKPQAKTQLLPSQQSDVQAPPTQANPQVQSQRSHPQTSPHQPDLQAEPSQTLHQPHLQLPPNQANLSAPPHATPQETNPLVPPPKINPPTAPIPQTPPHHPEPPVAPHKTIPLLQTPPNQLNLQGPRDQPNPQVPPPNINPPIAPTPQTHHPESPVAPHETPPTQLNLREPHDQSNPHASPHWSSTQGPHDLSNSQSLPHWSNPQVLPARDQATPQRSPHWASPQGPSHWCPHQPPHQPNSHVTLHRNTSGGRSGKANPPRQPNPCVVPHQQATGFFPPPLPPAHPTTHSYPPRYQHSDYRSSGQCPNPSSHSPPKNKGRPRWSPRSPMQHRSTKLGSHPAPSYGKPYVPYGPPPHLGNPRHPILQHPFSYPSFQTPPPLLSTHRPPLLRIPTNFQRPRPPGHHGPLLPFPGHHLHPQEFSSQPRSDVGCSSQAPNPRWRRQNPSMHQELLSESSQSGESHTITSSQQTGAVSASSTLSPTVHTFAQSHPPITPTDSESESDPDTSLQASPGLFEMLPPSTNCHDRSSVVSSVGVNESTISESIRISNNPSQPTGENPARESVPQSSSPATLPTANLTCSVNALPEESEDNKQTDAALICPSDGNTSPLHEEQSEVKVKVVSSVTQNSRDSTEKEYSDDAVSSPLPFPENVTSTPDASKKSASAIQEDQSTMPGQRGMDSISKCTDGETKQSDVPRECIALGLSKEMDYQYSCVPPRRDAAPKSSWVPLAQQIAPIYPVPHSDPLNFSVRLPRERQPWSSLAGISKEAIRPKSTLPPWVGTSPKPSFKSHPQPQAAVSSQGDVDSQSKQSLSNTSPVHELPVHPLLQMAQGQSHTASGEVVAQQQVLKGCFEQPACAMHDISYMLEKLSITGQVDVADTDVCVGLPTEGSLHNLESILK